jgi:hypothetical protein
MDGNPLLFMLGVLVLAITYLGLREAIEQAADAIIPFFTRPWQNVVVKIILWLIALMVISGIFYWVDGAAWIF